MSTPAPPATASTSSLPEVTLFLCILSELFLVVENKCICIINFVLLIYVSNNSKSVNIYLLHPFEWVHGVPFMNMPSLIDESVSCLQSFSIINSASVNILGYSLSCIVLAYL